jgi:hypothetical protein
MVFQTGRARAHWTRHEKNTFTGESVTEEDGMCQERCGCNQKFSLWHIRTGGIGIEIEIEIEIAIAIAIAIGVEFLAFSSISVPIPIWIPIAAVIIRIAGLQRSITRGWEMVYSESRDNPRYPPEADHEKTRCGDIVDGCYGASSGG